MIIFECIEFSDFLFEIDDFRTRNSPVKRCESLRIMHTARPNRYEKSCFDNAFVRMNDLTFSFESISWIKSNFLVLRCDRCRVTWSVWKHFVWYLFFSKLVVRVSLNGLLSLYNTFYTGVIFSKAHFRLESRQTRDIEGMILVISYCKIYIL